MLAGAMLAVGLIRLGAVGKFCVCPGDFFRLALRVRRAASRRDWAVSITIELEGSEVDGCVDARWAAG